MNRVYTIIIVAVVLCVVLFLAAHPLKENQFYPPSDEGRYYRFAKVISEKGLGGFSELIQHYMLSAEERKYPPPSRVGHVLLNSLAFKLFGAHYVVLGGISLVSFVLFLSMTFYFSRKHFGTDTALLSTLLLSSSPLMLTMSRRALADSTLNLLWGLAVWAFFDFLVNQKKYMYIIFVLSFAFALTIKETSVVFWPFFLISAILYKCKYKCTLSSMTIAGALLLPLIIAGSLYVSVLGGIDSLAVVVRAMFTGQDQARFPNPYAIQFCSGPWFRYIIDYLLLTPFTTLLFIGYFFHLLMTRRFEWKTTYFLLYFVVVYSIMSSLPHIKVVRYVINLEMVISLFGVLALYEILPQRDAAKRSTALLMAAVIIVFLNFKTFLSIFYYGGLLDPISYYLLMFKQFFPIVQ